MTGDELITLLKYENIYIGTHNKRGTQPIKTTDEKFVYGLKGIAKLLGCSVSSAMRLKKSGKINEAIIQDGRKIIVDVQKTLVLLYQEQSDT